MPSDRVTVAVRVRPWLGTDRGARRCSIAVDGNAAELLDPQNGGRRAQFCFDHCFDSLATLDAQADQEIIFDTLAGRLLTSAADGYNVTVFAYGQTGSGKSYTMTGSSAAPGFTPRFVSALCANCEAARQANPRSEYAIEASYLEIYNETIRDLLLPIRSGKGGKGAGASLRVREHPRTGPYVEDLSKIACSTAAQVSTLLEHGNSVRAVRGTNMNAASSRSHAIFSIRLTQRQPIDADADEDAAPTAGTPSRASMIERVSKVHLVDLAGSERAKRTGAAAVGRVQLSEAGAINSSLATLGAVISALAAAGRRGTTHVPYRESVLTFLLRDGLGGNARTLMLATVSPAAVDFQETWSTLRYADSAKRIVNEARPNLDPTQTLVLQLRDEIDELRAALRRGSGKGGGPADAAAMAAVREELGVSEKLMAEATETWEMKLRRAAALAEERLQQAEKMVAEPTGTAGHTAPGTRRKYQRMAAALRWIIVSGEEVLSRSQ
ncbi:kinesin family member 13b [Chrysochromulina tobinii]|uniref:Kinesin-like protein n=1 Tax=Chrysochromulina tobinii TaxID=1460289 RepID=A0A0M0K1A8_9EUKA|nr:kinesin family member 13b [Chrysochromulina tobinii]|eukprot:KOO32377.1 kinesin family member 13b [Chrysochromulina sp. CCMP291]